MLASILGDLLQLSFVKKGGDTDGCDQTIPVLSGIALGVPTSFSGEEDLCEVSHHYGMGTRERRDSEGPACSMLPLLADGTYSQPVFGSF